MRIKRFNTEFDVIETKTIIFWENDYKNWENETFDFIFKYLDKEKTFIDIGAWIGPISLVASSYSKNCICFEPDEVAFKELLDNKNFNFKDNIILENIAVSTFSEIQLGAHELGWSGTRVDCDQNIKNYKCIGIEQIFCKYNLSEKDVSVIKIDIEGHESELLKDKFLWNLNIPMHISLHPGWKSDVDKFYDDIIPFFTHKKCNINRFDTRNFYEITIE